MTDPVSLRLRFEEEILAAVPGDRSDFYRSVMVPFKLEKYIEYQSVRTLNSDVLVLVQTLLSGLFRGLVEPYRLEDVSARAKV